MKTLNPDRIYDRKRIICCGWEIVAVNGKSQTSHLSAKPAVTKAARSKRKK